MRSPTNKLSFMDDTSLMTAADHAALTAEVAELEGEGRRAIAQRIKTAREWGDLKENSEYHDAKNDQAHLETKIAVLRERLARAEVVEVSTVPVGVVSFGSGVHVRDEDGREQHFEIVSSNTAAPARERDGHLGADRRAEQRAGDRGLGRDLALRGRGGVRADDLEVLLAAVLVADVHA